MKFTTRNIVVCGLFSAIAFILTNIGNLIPIRFAGFLSFDPKDAIIVIAGFALGPLATIIISVAVAFIEAVTISTTQIIGFIMNIISSVSFALIPSLLYKKNRQFKTALIGLGISSVVTIILMLLWNYLITPIYMQIPREAVADMLLPVFLPFNAIKCAMNVVLVVVFYKPFVKALRKMVLLDPSKKKK
ncbi:MAG: ECF transporter S component [Clostridia bacterium]|nr:ECF transporter S component [Clostridia bacterium]